MTRYLVVSAPKLVDPILGICNPWAMSYIIERTFRCTPEKQCGWSEIASPMVDPLREHEPSVELTLSEWKRGSQGKQTPAQ